MKITRRSELPQLIRTAAMFIIESSRSEPTESTRERVPEEIVSLHAASTCGSLALWHNVFCEVA